MMICERVLYGVLRGNFALRAPSFFAPALRAVLYGALRCFTVFYGCFTGVLRACTINFTALHTLLECKA